MNNFARNINTTVAATINNNMGPAATPLNKKLYVWVLVIGAVVAIMYAIKRFIIDDDTLLNSFMDVFRAEQRRGTSEVAPPPIATGAAVAPAAVNPDTESWCFVGEDLTGRYCVRVPSAKSCDAARTFRSRQDCEMVPAHALPAGVVTKQGAGMLPLMGSGSGSGSGSGK